MFDILPVHGELAPGESSYIHFNFYGHSNILADVIAACKVEGGPTYELQLSGQAGGIHYNFNNKALEFGAVPYDRAHTAEIVLFNRGKVAFDFATVGVKSDMGIITPGEIVVSPSRGRISANQSTTFTVSFLPGTPETFSKSFEIAVAHFEPDVITLSGMAVYPSMVLLGLSRDTSNVPECVMEEAQASLEQKQEGGTVTTSDCGDVDSNRPMLQLSCIDSLNAEIDRLLVKKFAEENGERLFSKSHGRPRYRTTLLCM